MNREELEKKVMELVASQVSLDIEEIGLGKDFIGDLGFDSLDAVELTICIEDNFDMTISDEQADSLINVKLLADFIENNDPDIRTR